jgi:histidinol phosphatase-like enzyme
VNKHLLKLVIFDCDGVLLDSEGIGNRVETQALLTTLNIRISPDEYQRRFAGVTTEGALRKAGQEFGITISESFIKEVDEKILSALEAEAEIIPYVDEALKKINISKAVASNSHFYRLSKLLKAKKLIDFFDDAVFSADMVEHPKPAPDLYQHVLKKMLVSAQDCIVIEDSSAGVKAASQVGINTLGFINSPNPAKEDIENLLNAGASDVFTDMRELPGIINSLR